MQKWKFYVDTYGCKVNQYESQAMAEAWENLGGEKCQSPLQADYILINSCAITSKAERDARNAVYRLKREAPKAKIILAGCAAQFFNDFKPRKKAIWDRPDFCIPQSHKHLLLQGPENIENYILGTMPTVFPFSITDYYRGRPVIKIQDGCSQNCTYCIVPQTRGLPFSYPPEKIVAEMRHLLEAGYSELIISGINLRQYGKDIPEYGDFWRLMGFLDKELNEYACQARIRISSLEPCQLDSRGIDMLLNLKLVCPHIHLSLQHASPQILRKMGRGHYKAEDILDAVALIKAQWPVLGLGADIIGGFPGEKDTDLNYLLNFIDELPLTYAHVFPYSARQGTPAKNFPEQIIQKEKNRRAALIRERIDNKKKMFLQSLLALSSVKVAPDLLVNHAHKTGMRGVNEYYATCHFVEIPEQNTPHTLIPAKPVRVLDDSLEVKPVI